MALLKHISLLYFISFFCSYAYCDENIPHHAENSFVNPYDQKGKGGLFTYLKARLTTGKWGEGEHSSIPTEVVDLDKILEPDPSKIQITWIGHSTLLIQYRGKNILTDPIFSEIAGPVQFIGLRRYTPPAIMIEQLPRIDYVIVSHNHYDHLDLASVYKLGNDPLWIVPLKLKSWFINVGIDNVLEMDWWERWSDEKLSVVCTPSQHWSKRTMFDAFETLWASWAIKIDDFNFWFGGDTGYNTIQFKEIGEKLGPFDCAAIPIGSYSPREFMKPFHINPEEAVMIHNDIKSKQSLGIHWGTFVLSKEPIDEPPKRLAEALEKIPNAAPFIAIPIGRTVEIGLQAKNPENVELPK
ncbi:MAG: N-acyl-phosphatidylethanolamine-hydrolyzing phospholipase D [Chlamydiales bacterium]|jgi:N-acyl-phosphatidylethanolamine-hydrolysing phospholipase D